MDSFFDPKMDLFLIRNGFISDPKKYLFLELSSISLFKEKKIIIVREIKKLKSEKNKTSKTRQFKKLNPPKTQKTQN